MGKIFYLIGKSATGKDSLKERLVNDPALGLFEVTQYTTRPIRDGEEEGREYHFISIQESERLKAAGKIIEMREYQTIHGPWRYMLVDDGSIDLEAHDVIAVGTIASYLQVAAYFGEEKVVPLYIQVETGERLERALSRERNHARPKYAEMCRRFLSDEADFDEEHLKAAGLLTAAGEIRNCFENNVFEDCLREIRDFILKEKDS